MAWVDRLIAATQSNTSWNTDAEKQSVLNSLENAQKSTKIWRNEDNEGLTYDNGQRVEEESQEWVATLLPPVFTF